jgi:multicomponent Na+:H+ antiporter subunit D
MGGLQERMPVTASTNLIASMSISGIPPFNGFWSKLIIILACVQANRFGYALLTVAASILTLVSFAKVQKYAFFGQLNQKWQNIKEAPWTMKLSMIVLGGICITAGLLLLPALRPFLQSATDVLLLGTGYKDAFFMAIK